MTSGGRASSKALLWIFTASGFAGLVYQSIWTHYLGLILGHSAYAQALVLALFMGGMALGAWIISRRSESLKRPLAVYAAAELVLAVFGIGFHAYFQAVSGWAYEGLFPALSSGLPLELARWSIASLLILPQCVLLGMTFPLMSAGYIRLQPDSRGNILAGLYFSNSLGAAVGALASTFVLLPAVGLPGTVMTAGIIGVFVAIAVWPISKLEQPTPVAPTAAAESGMTGSAPAFILLMAAITGASSFVYEVSWVRMLSMVLGSTIHAFEIMLASFIAGIAFGGLWLRKRADGLASPRRAAGWAQIAMGCMALSTLFLYNQSFAWLEWIMQALNRQSESAYALYNIASAAISMVIMFPTAFFAGMTLPLLTLTLLKDGAGEAAIGKAYAANTLGAITGVVLAVFVGLPLAGLRMSLWLAAAADILIGVLLLATVGGLSWTTLRRLDWKVPAGIGASTVLLMVALLFSHFDPVLMSSSLFRTGTLESKHQVRIISHQDGRTASVTIREIDGKVRAILTNGKPDASISMIEANQAADETTMMAAAVLSLIHHHDVRTAAIIGFGSGMTTHTFLGDPAVESVDTIEIEPAMIEAAKAFRPIVERAYTDPRSHLIIDDAKSYFAATGKKYDAIVSEPSNPWVNGVASLFTEEFYRLVPHHLNENGIFVQWLQAYEITPTLVSSILKAMTPNFSDIRLFVGAANDLLLVATPKGRLPSIRDLGLPPDWNPAFRKELAERGFDRSETLPLMVLGDRDLIEKFTAMYWRIGANSDYFPLVQLGAPQARFNGSAMSELGILRTQRLPVAEVVAAIPPARIDTSISGVLLSQHPHIAAIRRAQEFSAALSGRTRPAGGDHLGMADRIGIRSLRAAGLECRLDSLGNDGLVMLTTIAGTTIPFLHPDDLRDNWVKPAWMKCAAKDPMVNDYLELLAAAASRNHASTSRIGEAFLGRYEQRLEQSELRSTRDYVLGITQLASLALKEHAKVLQLEERHGKGLDPDFSRRFILHSARLDGQKAGQNQR